MKREKHVQIRHGSRIWRWSFLVGSTLVMSGSLHAQSLTWLGTGGGVLSDARGVSADGSVVVGALNRAFNYRAFRWS